VAAGLAATAAGSAAAAVGAAAIAIAAAPAANAGAIEDNPIRMLILLLNGDRPATSSRIAAGRAAVVAAGRRRSMLVTGHMRWDVNDDDIDVMAPSVA
jgi:hypothetical protein